MTLANKDNASPESPLHLIYKQIPENPPDWIIQGQIFRKEHAVYRTVIPALVAFSSSRSHPYNPPLPKLYKGFNNDKRDYLLLQDVRPSGFQMVNKRRSLTFPEMSLILTELAKFHATSYAYLRHEGLQILETNPDFAIMSRDLFPPSEDGVDMFDGMIHLYFSTVAHLMSQQLPELAPRITKIVPNAVQIRKSVIKNPSYFETIIHSDLWTNNLLLKYDDDAKKVPIAVKFIDFQMTQTGNVFSDLGYLIYTSTTPEFRKDHLLPVLETYYDAFSLTLSSLGCPLPPGFSLGFLLDQFRACRLAFLIHMAFAVPLQLGDMVGVEAEWEENKKNTKDEEVKDNDGDMGALGSEDGIKQMIIRSPIALQRFRELFEEAAKLNVI